jgi:hypothetical protein
VHECTQENSLSSSRRGVSKEDTRRAVECSVAQQGVLECEISRRASNSPLKGNTRAEFLRDSSRKSSGWIAQLCVGILQGVQR